jgi:uncharacterized protein
VGALSYPPQPPARSGTWSTQRTSPHSSRGAAPPRPRPHTHSYFSWSAPTTSRLRITATPRITFDAAAPGNVWVRLWDVAPGGTAVMFDENVALIQQAGRVAFDLKSTDWTFDEGHQLGVQVGTISSRSWRDTPSGNTIHVTGARLSLALQDPQADVPTQGDRSPFLDTYLRQFTQTLTGVGEGTFPLALGPRP